MKIALCADEAYPVHAVVLRELAARGHEVVPFGAVTSRATEHGTGAAGEAAPAVPWAQVAEHAALAVSQGVCEEGIFFCWSGTGISMAANKVAGIRAALCTDAETARAARVWNHANVLCLSHRLLSEDLAKEILAAWFDTHYEGQGAAGVALLTDLDRRTRR